MINDNEINNIEKYIPKLADGAFRKAYIDTLSQGNSVLIAEDGKLVKVSADGSKNILKDIPKHQSMTDQMVLTK